jgi:hypothetical protein
MAWTEEEHQELVKLKHNGWTYREIAEMLSEKFERSFSFDSVRNRWRRTQEVEGDMDEIPPYNDKFEKKSNGTHFSDKLIELSEDEIKNEESVMKAHGYDPDKWDLINVKASVWHHFNKKMKNPKTLHASKITVSPKHEGVNFDKFIEVVKQVPKYNMDTNVQESDTYLNVTLADMHFGIAKYKNYIDTQTRIVNLIRKGHKEILFIVGNDLFHVDNFRNTTASGREIQHVDLIKAWEDAKLFYYPLLEEAIKNSDKVKVIYTKGNHSESFEWSFVQMLKERYSQVEFDDEFKERKVAMLGLNFCGTNHGDKKSINKLTENFAVEFPVEWSQAKTRTVYTGHLHHERVIDKGGLILRQLPSGVDADIWHDDMGYTTAHKRFQVHEFEYDSEKCIHYV